MERVEVWKKIKKRNDFFSDRIKIKMIESLYKWILLNGKKMNCLFIGCCMVTFE